jgi:hypothetical protein
MPTGPLETGSRHYLRRPTDDEILRHLEAPRGVVNLKGPKQTGKSSAILQLYAARDRGDLRVVLINFESMPARFLRDIEVLWKQIVQEAAEQLGLPRWTPACWKDDAGYRHNLRAFFKDHVFADDPKPVVMCFDELDRQFDRERGVKEEFRATVRHLFTQAAYDPLLKRVRWLLAFSSEPIYYLGEIDWAPLDVGRKVDMRMFEPEEVRELSRRHGLEWEPTLVEKIIEYGGGRPQLTQEIVYHARSRPQDRSSLFDAEKAGEAALKDYLSPYLLHLQADDALKQAMKTILDRGECKDYRLVERLEAAGLVRRSQQGVVPLCRLYADSFSSRM